MIVVDASALANAVGDDGADGAHARAALAGQEVSVPDLVDVEVVSVLRRGWLAKTISARRFATAIDDLAALPADRYPVLLFIPRAYELRANVSAYDATYVALAEHLGCPRLTARSPGYCERPEMRHHRAAFLTRGSVPGRSLLRAAPNTHLAATRDSSRR